MSFALIHSVMRVSVIVLVIVCGGCGASGSDDAASPQSTPIARVSHAERSSAAHLLPIGDATMVKKKIERNVNGTAFVHQSGDHPSESISSVPLSVAKDMQSPEPRDRYRALDYWDARDSKAPLDLVFEAIEDDDPAVRAKATTIVEQYWAAEEEKGDQ